jgi:hypothetical protein
MQSFTIKPLCPHCSEEVPVQINTWTGDFKVLGAKPKADRAQLLVVINRYREIKGYTDDKMPTWQKVNGRRAFGEAKRLVTFFGGLEDPAGVAIECIEATAKQADREGWSWHLGTVAKRADEWLAKMQKGATK